MKRMSTCLKEDLITTQQRRKWLGLLCAAFLIVSCSSSSDSELARYINEIKSRQARPIEPIPSFAPLPDFSYPEDKSRRNPFKPKEIKVVDNLAPNTNRQKQPLEKFSLDALKFVGVLREQNKIWALITVPSGEVARVKLGDYMGKNYGKVIQITETHIKLQELSQIAGKWEKHITTININTGQ